MKTIVIYESGTGFTEQYAKWIAESLNCDCKSRKKVSKSEIASYDRIIYGGWIMGGEIQGLKKIREIANPFAVFAVGSSPAAYKEIVETVQNMNLLGEIPFFYFEGGFHFEKLSFFKKCILKALKKIVEQKIDRNRQEEFMAKSLGTSFDNSDKKQIEPLLELCNKE